jgi:cardiolipin synthase
MARPSSRNGGARRSPHAPSLRGVGWLTALRQRLKGRKWPIVVISCVGVVAFLLLLAQDPVTLHVKSAHRASDPAFPEYVAALANAPLEYGGRYDILKNGDEIYPAMLAAIARAKTRVELETYNYMQGEAERAFSAALIAAARRGVTVRVVLDNVGASKPDRAVRDEFKRAGVRLVWFNPIGFWTIEATNYRTHRKLLIVDGDIAFTGGVGVADHWLGHAQDKDHWRDTHFAVHGPAVRVLESCFFENWIEAGGEDAPELGPPPAADASGPPTLVLWSNPTSGVSNIKLLYMYSIAAATQTIDIQSPYFVLDASVRIALSEARRRGVRIRILTDGEITDTKSVKHASRNEYAALLDAGDRIFEYGPTMMHAKTMVVDGQWSIFGSANFDNRSLELNDEIAIAVRDADLAHRLTADFNADLTRSREWHAAEWHARPWHWKVREKMWGLFGEVF